MKSSTFSILSAILILQAPAFADLEHIDKDTGKITQATKSGPFYLIRECEPYSRIVAGTACAKFSSEKFYESKTDLVRGLALAILQSKTSPLSINAQLFSLYKTKKNADQAVFNNYTKRADIQAFMEHNQIKNNGNPESLALVELANQLSNINHEFSELNSLNSDLSKAVAKIESPTLMDADSSFESFALQNAVANTRQPIVFSDSPDVVLRASAKLSDGFYSGLGSDNFSFEHWTFREIMPHYVNCELSNGVKINGKQITWNEGRRIESFPSAYSIVIIHSNVDDLVTLGDLGKYMSTYCYTDMPLNQLDPEYFQ